MEEQILNGEVVEGVVEEAAKSGNLKAGAALLGVVAVSAVIGYFGGNGIKKLNEARKTKKELKEQGIEDAEFTEIEDEDVSEEK